MPYLGMFEEVASVCEGLVASFDLACLWFGVVLFLGHLFNLNGIAVYRLNEVYLDS